LGAEGPDRDAQDAAAIYDLLEKNIVPLFYDVDEEGVSHGWVAVMKETIKMTGPGFSARRMAKEYTERFYRKALETAMKTESGWERGSAKVDLFGGI
jgi:glycogen phosphorylase